MRCLVTGVAGFIGSHLAERLLKEGHEVIGIDDFSDNYSRDIKEQNLEISRSWRRFAFIEGDLLTLPLLPVLDGIEWVFHQAAQVGVRTSWGKDFLRYVDTNEKATQLLLESALAARTVQRFVYASSSSVYGETATFPLTETMKPQPISPYGVTKLAGEYLCRLYQHNFGLPAVALRYFTVYGPRQRPDMAFHRFCKAVLQHQSIPVFGDGLQTRDFTYVADVVEANMRAATAVTAPGQVLNIAGGSRVSIHDVLALLREISNTPVDVVFDQKQAGDVAHTCADIKQAEQILGYHPCTVLQEGLAREFEYILALYQHARSSML